MFSTPQSSGPTQNYTAPVGTNAPSPPKGWVPQHENWPGISNDAQNAYKDIFVPGAQLGQYYLRKGVGFMPVGMSALPELNQSYQDAWNQQLHMAAGNQSNNIGNQGVDTLNGMVRAGGMPDGANPYMYQINKVATGQNQIGTQPLYQDMYNRPLSGQQQAAQNVFGSMSTGGGNVATGNFAPFLGQQMNAQQGAAFNQLGNLNYIGEGGFGAYAQGQPNTPQAMAMQAAGKAMGANPIGFAGLDAYINAGGGNAQTNAAVNQLNNLGSIDTGAIGSYVNRSGGNAKTNAALRSFQAQANGQWDVSGQQFQDLYGKAGGPSYAQQNLQSIATQTPGSNPYLDQLESLINDQIVAQAKSAASAAGRGYGSGYESGQVADAISRNVLRGRLNQYNTDIQNKMAANSQLDQQRLAGLSAQQGLAGDLANLSAGNFDRRAQGANSIGALGQFLSQQQLSGINSLAGMQGQNVNAQLNRASRLGSLGQALSGQTLSALNSRANVQGQNAQLQANARQELGAQGDMLASQRLQGLQGLANVQGQNLNAQLGRANQLTGLGNTLAQQGLTSAQNIADIQGQNQNRALTAAQQLGALGQQGMANRQQAANSITNVQGTNIANRVNSASTGVQALQQGQQDVLRSIMLQPELNAARYADSDRRLALAQAMQNRSDTNFSQQRMDAQMAQQAPWERLAAYMQAMNGNMAPSQLGYETAQNQLNAQKPSGFAQTLGTIGTVGGLLGQAGLLQPMGNAIQSAGSALLGGLF